MTAAAVLILAAVHLGAAPPVEGPGSGPAAGQTAGHDVTSKGPGQVVVYVFDTGAVPFAGVTVQIGEREAVTGDDGVCRLPAIEGVHEVLIIPPEGAAITTPPIVVAAR